MSKGDITSPFKYLFGNGLSLRFLCFRIVKNWARAIETEWFQVVSYSFIPFVEITFSFFGISNPVFSELKPFLYCCFGLIRTLPWNINKYSWNTFRMWLDKVRCTYKINSIIQFKPCFFLRCLPERASPAFLFGYATKWAMTKVIHIRAKNSIICANIFLEDFSINLVTKTDIFAPNIVIVFVTFATYTKLNLKLLVHHDSG